jgi:hypothetical protein
LASFSNAISRPTFFMRSLRNGRSLRQTVFEFLTRPARRVIAPGIPTPTGVDAMSTPAAFATPRMSSAVVSTIAS